MFRRKPVTQTVTIVPKDSVGQRLTLEGVVCWFHSHGAYTFVFDGGKSRTYPESHVWYVEG